MLARGFLSVDVRLTAEPGAAPSTAHPGQPRSEQPGNKPLNSGLEPVPTQPPHYDFKAGGSFTAHGLEAVCPPARSRRSRGATWQPRRSQDPAGSLGSRIVWAANTRHRHRLPRGRPEWEKPPRSAPASSSPQQRRS